MNNRSIQSDPAAPEYKKIKIVPIALTAFITPFMGSALNLSIPAISAEFMANAVSMGWVITIFLLISTSFSVPFGRIADIYGKKKFFLAGTIIFTIASMICIFASGIRMLLICRGIQGLGAAMIFATNTALISAIFPPQVRGRMMGTSVTLTYLGLAMGPVIGGQLNHYFGWRSIFIFTSVFCVITILVIIIFLKEPDSPASGSPGAPASRPSIDWHGNWMYILAISLLLFALTELTDLSYSWVILIAAIVFIVIFIRHELRAESPLLDMKLFTSNISFALSNAAALLNYGASFSISYLLSIYLQNVQGYNSQTAGLILITAPVMQTLLSIKAGKLSDTHSPYILASIGMTISAAGLFALIFIKEETPLGLIIAALAFVGVGFAFFSSPNTNAIMSSVDKSKYGVASSVMATSRTLGQSINTAMITSIMCAVMGHTALVEASHAMIISSMRISFIICTVLSVLGIYCSAKRKQQ